MPERRAWTPEEDEALKYLREQLSINKWSLIAKKLAQDYEMYGRTGKQCRQRYHNHLDSSIMHSEWSRQEQLFMYKLHDELGNKWAIISQKLPGRTDNCVKNHFYSKLRKAIRKLNKIIHDNFRKEFKEIKITILYKIIQAADEKFKNSPSIDEQVSENCSNLKRMLLEYSNDDDNEFQDNLQRLKALIKAIYEFSSSYRRKPKRCRKSSAHANDLLKVPKFEKKIKSSSDKEESQSDYSFVFSHSSNDMKDEEDEDEGEEEQELDGVFKNKCNILEDVMEEEDNKELENQKIEKVHYLNAQQNKIKNQQVESIEQMLLNEGKISIPIPFIHRTSSLRSDNQQEMPYEKPDMFSELVGDMDFSNNLNDEDMDDENKLFTNN